MLKKRMQEMENVIAVLMNVNKQEKEESKRKIMRQKEYEARLNPQGYCWSCGYKVVYGHDSTTCRKRILDHKCEATRQNTMGGSSKNMGWKPRE